MKMLRFFRTFFLMTFFLCANVFAAPIPINLVDFTGSETVISFNSISNETPINNQFSTAGVIFSGALYGLTNPGDTDNFPNSGGVIASNFISSQQQGVQGNSFTATFDTYYTKVGFYLETNPDDASTVTISYDGISSGSLTFNTTDFNAIFVGLEETIGFNSVTMVVQNTFNGFFAIDDFRFEGTPNTGPGPNPVPEPSTILLLSIGVTGLMGLRKKLIH
jgi:hypothetical protein